MIAAHEGGEECVRDLTEPLGLSRQPSPTPSMSWSTPACWPATNAACGPASPSSHEHWTTWQTYWAAHNAGNGQPGSQLRRLSRRVRDSRPRRHRIREGLAGGPGGTPAPARPRQRGRTTAPVLLARCVGQPAGLKQQAWDRRPADLRSWAASPLRSWAASWTKLTDIDWRADAMNRRAAHCSPNTLDSPP